MRDLDFKQALKHDFQTLKRQITLIIQRERGREQWRISIEIKHAFESIINNTQRCSHGYSQPYKQMIYQ